MQPPQRAPAAKREGTISAVACLKHSDFGRLFPARLGIIGLGGSMKRPTMRWTALAALAMGLAASSCSRRPEAGTREQVEASNLVSKPAPDFTLTDATGANVK